PPENPLFPYTTLFRSVWSCTGNATAQPDGSHVIVGLGEAVTCTITNTDNPGTLKLVKNVVNNDGGTATPHGYTLFASAAGNPLKISRSHFCTPVTYNN